MEDTLIIEDTLLYIAIGLIAFGFSIMPTIFWQGITALTLAAGIVIARIVLKKQGILKRDNALVDRIMQIEKITEKK